MLSAFQPNVCLPLRILEQDALPLPAPYDYRPSTATLRIKAYAKCKAQWDAR